VLSNCLPSPLRLAFPAVGDVGCLRSRQALRRPENVRPSSTTATSRSSSRQELIGGASPQGAGPSVLKIDESTRPDCLGATASRYYDPGALPCQERRVPLRALGQRDVLDGKRYEARSFRELFLSLIRSLYNDGAKRRDWQRLFCRCVR
jgi:hypothetical protein